MKKYERRNFLIVISAPSGGGKTTICRAILNRMDDVDYSISYTTRKPRADEVNGESYFFVSEEEFRCKLREGDFLEHAIVHNNYYGTSRSFVLEKFSGKRNVIMDIDVQGAVNVVDSGIDCVTIFLLPPDEQTLRSRLEKRNSDPQDVIELRLANAVNEIKCIDKYDYLVINDNLEQAINEVQSIIVAEGNRAIRYRAPGKVFYGGISGRKTDS